MDRELWPGRHAHRRSDMNASGEAPGDNDGPATASASRMAVNRIEWPTPWERNESEVGRRLARGAVLADEPSV